MNNTSVALPIELDPPASESAGPAVAPVVRELVPLREALRHIRQDAAQEPLAYLAETIVPLGGE